MSDNLEISVPIRGIGASVKESPKDPKKIITVLQISTNIEPHKLADIMVAKGKGQPLELTITYPQAEMPGLDQ